MKKILYIVTTFILIICGSLLVGCNNPYSGLSLSFDEDSIVLLVGQDSSYNLKVNNFNQDIDLSFDVQGNVAKVISYQYIDNGIYSFTLKPLVDETIDSNLKISVLGTNKSLIIPLKISLEIQSISLNSNPYIVKKVGEKLDLNQLNFIFNPTSTFQTKLNFAVNDKQFNGVIEVVDDGDDRLSKEITEDSIFYISKSLASENSTLKIKATSAYKEDIYLNFDVKAVNEIKNEQINVFEYKPNSDEENRQVSEYTDTTKDDYIELIINEQDYSSKVIEVQRQIIPPFYAYDINVESLNGSQSVLTIECIESDTTVRLESNYKFKLSAQDVSENEFIVLTLYSMDFPDYKVIKRYRVVSQIIPSNVRINNSNASEKAILYDTNTSVDAKVFNISMYEQQSMCSTMTVKFERITKTGRSDLELSEVLEYISFTINGIKIGDDGDIDFINNLIKPNLTNEIKAYGIKPYEAESSIAMVFTATANYGHWKYKDSDDYEMPLTKNLTNEIVFNVYKGAKIFDLADDFKELDKPTLYIKKGETQVFQSTKDGATGTFQNDAFNFGEDGGDVYIGEIYPTLSIESVGICSVSQYYTGGVLVERAIEIKGLQTGTAYCTLKIDSGLVLVITIVVYEPLNIQQTSISFEANSNISQYEFGPDTISNAGGNYSYNITTLKTLVISGTNNIIKLIYSVNENATLYEIDDFVTNNSTKIEILDKNRLIFKTLEDTEDSTVSIKVKTFGVTNFKKSQIGIIFTYNINITTYIPIQSFSLEAKNKYDESVDGFSNIVDVYSNKELGYYDKLLSKIEFSLTKDNNNETITTQDVNRTLTNNSVSITFSLNSSSEKYNGKDSFLIKSGPIEYGHFYIDGNIAYFDCVKNMLDQNDSFKVYATITQYGKTYASSVTVNIKQYVKAKEIWLKNYTDSIYLDSRTEHSSVKIYPYIMPLNVINQEIFVKYEPDSSTSVGSVQITKQDDSFDIKYTGVGYGSGYIYLIPMSAFTSETDYTTNSSIRLKVTVADGRTKESPIHISTLEELKAIDNTAALSRHYILTQIINAQGDSLSFGNLTGSISGLYRGKQLGGISNFTISNINPEGYAGLFTKIEDGAELSYLTISGKFDITKPATEPSQYNIGLLAGENNGTIKNVFVSVLANSSKDDINLSGSNQPVNIGFVVGKNNSNGDITITNEDDRELSSTLLAYNNKNTFINISCNNAGNVGGIAGKNSGNISTDCTDIQKVNLYGTNAHIYIKSNCQYLGGVAGENDGTITNIVAVGELCAYKEAEKTRSHTSIVGGLVGHVPGKSIIQNNTSRVFVRGYSNVSGLIGTTTTPAITDALIISGNIVQAVDDGTRPGIDASLIVLLFTDGATGSLAQIYTTVVKAGAVVDDSVVSELQARLKNNNNNETYFAEYTTNGSIITTTDNSRKLIKDTPINNINEYYGDIVAYNFTGNIVKQLGTGENFMLLKSATLNKLQNLPNKKIMQYYKAKNSAYQIYLSDLNQVALDISTSEHSLKIISGTCLEVLPNGKINILSTGFATIRVTNSLNYKDYHDISVFVTNKVDGVRFYEDIDGTILISDNSLVNVTDSKNTLIYPKFYANAPKNDGNLYIELVENTDLTLEPAVNGNLEIALSKNTLSISAKKGTHGDYDVDFKIKYTFEDQSFYLKYDEGNKISEFINAGGNATATTLKVNAVSGIYNLNVDKYIVDNVIPSDILNFVVTYNNNNTDDTLKLVVSDKNGNIFEEKQGGDGNIYLSNGVNDIFVVEKIQNNDDNSYSVKYKITLNTNSSSILNNITYLSNNSLSFSFSGSLTQDITKEIKTIIVNYQNEPIKSVLIKNFNQDSNGQLVIVDENTGEKTYNAKNSLIDSDVVVSGDVNILKIYIDSYFANFDYIDITSDSVDSYFASFNLIAKTNAGNGDFNYQQVGDVAYINNGIRIDKNHLKLEKTDNNYLIIPLIYRLPSDVSENAILNINVAFLDSSFNNVKSFTKSLKTKKTRAVSMELVDKVSKNNDNEDVKYYDVARGYEYEVNISHYGFEENEITIISSSPYAKIEKINGIYILKISDSIVYHVGSEYEEVIISAYGTKIVEGKAITSKNTYLILDIYEYVFDQNKGLMGLFEQNPSVSLALSTTVDVREAISKLLHVECSPSARDSLDLLIKNFISGSNFYIKSTSFKDDLKGEANSTVTDYYFKNYLFTPYKIYNDNNYPYSFIVSADISYSMGRLEFSEIETENDRNTVEIEIEVYSVSSIKNPTPIYSLQDLLSLKEFGNYRLMQDITINSSNLTELGYTTFNPITANFSSLDGNGYSINLQGVYRYVDVNTFGLFSEISENAIIKNLNINISGTLTVYINNITNQTTLNIGILSAVNNGVINNCSITYSKNFACIFNISASDESLIGALVGENNGYITNSRVNVRLTSNGASVAGFVGKNNKHIASSYVAKSNITNDSGTVDSTSIAGGFVLYNNGNIFTSYIKGEQSRSTSLTIYSANTDYALYSNNRVAGFVYGNSGTIEDCYADIPIISSSYNAGFVYENVGLISRVYSTSVVESSQSVNFPFVYSYQKGKFENCFFLKDENWNVNNNTSPLNDGLSDQGIKKLTIKDFNNESNFKDFAISSSEEAELSDKSIWFMAKNNALEGTTSDGFAYRYIDSNFQIYDIASNSLNNITFVGRRPELVSANTIAVSQYEIDNFNTKTDPTTGEIIYAYNLRTTKALNGTKYNPYVITSATELEEIVFGSNAYTTCYNCIRLAKDLDYEQDNIKTSQLYKKTFSANIDGNNLSISNFVINDSKSMTYSGFIGKIGDEFNTSSLRCFNLYPKYINTPNATYAGTLSGYIINTVICNVNVLTSVDVVSKNIVGGLVGFAKGSSIVSNCQSLANSKASYLTTEDKSLDSMDILTYRTNGSVGTLSYAGGILGYASGKVKIQNNNIGEDVKVQAMIAGLVAGGISEDSTIDNMELKLKPQIMLGAYYACGYVVGESYGKIFDVTVEFEGYNDYDETDLLDIYSNDSKNPISGIFSPYIAGGFVGIMRSGEIKNATINAPVIAKKSMVVGGLVGYMKKGTIESVGVTTTLCGEQYVGGVIGYHVGESSGDKVNIDSINFKQYSINTIYRKLSSSITDLYIGKIIGYSKSNIQTKVSTPTDKPEIAFIIKIEVETGIDLKLYYNYKENEQNNQCYSTKSNDSNSILESKDYDSKDGIIIKADVTTV